ncbi:unnamed protein product [Phytophthora fragariaefolia]|uniref:Unnamed protein product n=1 Tax=Phytophthora fragariaefolia TaxID=1490495 RepID=A0A9W7CSP3_9STRA|nr:unnamed protein product [Phytophthora fragariaefolia]
MAFHCNSSRVQSVLVKYETKQQVGPHTAGHCHRERHRASNSYSSLRGCTARCISAPSPASAPATSYNNAHHLVRSRRPEPDLKRLRVPSEDDASAQEALEDGECHVEVAVRVAARVHPRPVGRQHGARPSGTSAAESDYRIIGLSEYLPFYRSYGRFADFLKQLVELVT